jgi:hypothetical protein
MSAGRRELLTEERTKPRWGRDVGRSKSLAINAGNRNICGVIMKLTDTFSQ